MVELNVMSILLEVYQVCFRNLPLSLKGYRETSPTIWHLTWTLPGGTEGQYSRQRSSRSQAGTMGEPGLFRDHGGHGVGAPGMWRASATGGSSAEGTLGANWGRFCTTAKWWECSVTHEHPRNPWVTASDLIWENAEGRLEGKGKSREASKEAIPLSRGTIPKMGSRAGQGDGFRRPRGDPTSKKHEWPEEYCRKPGSEEEAYV